MTADKTSSKMEQVPTPQEDIFYEAEYKLQNCLRITLSVEIYTTEVEVLPGVWWPVTEYVTRLIERKVLEGQIKELERTYVYDAMYDGINEWVDQKDISDRLADLTDQLNHLERSDS